MVDYPPTTNFTKVGFDARLHWNEILGHCLEDIRLNRIASNYQAWFNSLWTLYDMGKTYLTLDDVKFIDNRMNDCQKLIWRYDGLTNLNDIKNRNNRKIIGFKIQQEISYIQVEVLRKMGEKGMFLPLKVPTAEWDETDIASGMGM